MVFNTILSISAEIDFRSMNGCFLKRIAPAKCMFIWVVVSFFWECILRQEMRRIKVSSIVCFSQNFFNQFFSWTKWSSKSFTLLCRTQIIWWETITTTSCTIKGFLRFFFCLIIKFFYFSKWFAISNWFLHLNTILLSSQNFWFSESLSLRASELSIISFGSWQREGIHY